MATLETLVVNLKAQTAEFSQGMKRAESGVASLQRSVARAGTAIAGYFGGRQILRGFESVLRAYGQQEQAEQSLRAALAATGKAGEASFRVLTDHAAQMQRQFKQADETLIEATSTLSLLAPSLDTSELQQAQRAIVGIADTFLKGDVEAAARLVGKTFASTTNALTRYGIQVDMTGTQQEKLAQILEVSNRLLAASEARGRTLFGRLRQLGNSWGDLREKVGQFISESLGIPDMLARIADVMDAVSAILARGGPDVGRAAKLLGEAAGVAFVAAFLKYVEELPQLLAKVWGKVPIVGPALALPFRGAAAVGGAVGVDRASTAMLAKLDEILKELQRIAEQPDIPTGTMVPIPLPGGGYTLVPMGGRAPTVPTAPGPAGFDISRISTMPQRGYAIPGQYFGQQYTIDELVTKFMPDVSIAMAAHNKDVIAAAESFDVAKNITVAAFGEIVEAARWGSKSMVEYFAEGIGLILQQLAQGKTGEWWGIIGGVGQVLASFQEGGVVPGPPGSARPIIAHAGELVLPPDKMLGGAGSIVVNQKVEFNVAALDGPSVARLLQEQKGTIAQVVAEAAGDSATFRRLLLRGGV